MDAAKPPVGSPAARLEKWLADYQAGKYSNASDEAKDTFEALKATKADPTTQVRGLWVQVGVPAVGSSTPNGMHVRISQWEQ